MKNQRQSSQPWWIIFLLIPLIVSCSAVTPQLWKISIYVGEHLIQTAAGKIIEVVLDKIIVLVLNRDDLGEIIVDKDNPLKGYNTAQLKFVNTTPNCKVEWKSEKKPRMVRDSIESTKWRLEPNARKQLDNAMNVDC